MKSIGIDVGSYSVKVVEIQTTTKGFQVNHFYEHKLSNAANSDHDLEIIDFLREFTSKYDANQTKFIMALPQDRVAIRNKILPFVDRLKIQKSLFSTLEDDIPFAIENAVLDAKVIRFHGPSSEILAAATPKLHVAKAMQFAQDIGVDLAQLSTEGLAFANVIERWAEPPLTLPAQTLAFDDNDKPSRDVQVVLQMGHSRTLICAFENNTLIGVRSTQWGGKNIAEAIARKYEIPYFEALKELETKAFILTNKQGASFDQVTFSETIAKCVRELIRDVQLSILEFKAEFNAEIQSVGITGGCSQIQNLGAFLTQSLEVPVNKVATLQNFNNVLFEKTSSLEAKISLALGLAVEGLKKPRNPALNFLRGEFAPQNHRLQAFWDKWSYTAKYAAAALVILFVYSYARESFSISMAEQSQTVMKEQAKSVARLTGRNATENNIRKYIRENKKRAADLKTLSSITKMNSAMDILKKITDAAPAKNSVTLDVRRLNVEQSNVSLEGYVNSPRELTLLQQSLANITSNGKVNAANSTLRQMPGRVSFAFNFQVDRGIQRTVK